MAYKKGDKIMAYKKAPKKKKMPSRVKPKKKY